MKQEMKIIQEIPYQSQMDLSLIERWAEIPVFDKRDPSHPEWTATPIHTFDLSREGYGLIHVKDESVNPTGTIKDRPAWEHVSLFRDFARSLYLHHKGGSLPDVSEVTVPRFSLITSGNAGEAVSEAFRTHGLPPLKVLVDLPFGERHVETLRTLYADVYATPLKGKPLTSSDIQTATRNEGGIDLTSLMTIEPQAVYYDWHVHEAFNTSPDSVFLPYGSGRLFENYLTWQFRNARTRDPRLVVSNESLARMNILGAEPEKLDSVADKLTKPFNPFAAYSPQDITSLHRLAFSGSDTGVYTVPEARLNQAYDLLSRFVRTEHSAAAGLALYLQRFDEGLVREDENVLIINTGKGDFCS